MAYPWVELTSPEVILPMNQATRVYYGRKDGNQDDQDDKRLIGLQMNVGLQISLDYGILAINHKKLKTDKSSLISPTRRSDS